MKNVFFIFLAVIAGIMGAKALAIHETIPAETTIALPSAYDAEAVYRYIKVLRPYSRWDLWPGKGKLYKGSQPHGAYLTTYINDTASLSIRRKESMRPGSLIVKENYTPAKKLDTISVMYKVEGYNPAAGDWFWARYGDDGKVLKAGKVQACIDCHSANKPNDFVMTEDFIK